MGRLRPVVDRLADHRDQLRVSWPSRFHSFRETPAAGFPLTRYGCRRRLRSHRHDLLHHQFHATGVEDHQVAPHRRYFRGHVYVHRDRIRLLDGLRDTARPMAANHHQQYLPLPLGLHFADEIAAAARQEQSRRRPRPDEGLVKFYAGKCGGGDDRASPSCI